MKINKYVKENIEIWKKQHHKGDNTNTYNGKNGWKEILEHSCTKRVAILGTLTFQFSRWLKEKPCKI
jgi:hypothetical protein